MRFTWHRGASFALALRVIAGTVAGTETVRCVMKEAVDGLDPPGDAAAEKVVFSSTFVAESGDEPAHWLFTATAADGLALSPGLYLADARIVIGSDVIQTTTVQIELVERITEASA